MTTLKKTAEKLARRMGAKKGATLPLVLSMLGVILVVSVTVATISMSAYQNSYGRLCRSQAYFTAESMANLALNQFKTNEELRSNIISDLAAKRVANPDLPLKDIYVDMKIDNVEGAMGNAYLRVKYGNKSGSEIRIESHGEYKGFKEVVSIKIVRTSKGASELAKIFNNAFFINSPVVDLLVGSINGNVYCDNPKAVPKLDTNGDKNIIGYDQGGMPIYEMLDSSYKYYEFIGATPVECHTKTKDIYNNTTADNANWVEVFIRSWQKDAAGNYVNAINGDLIVADNALIGLLDVAPLEHGTTYNLMYDGWDGAGQLPYYTKLRMKGNVHVKGDCRMENIALQGSAYVQKQLVIDSNQVSISGNIHAGDNVSISNCTIGGSIYADGDVYINNATINGDIHAKGDVIISNGSKVRGNVIAKDGINGKVAVNRSDVNGIIYAEGNVDVTGAYNLLWSNSIGGVVSNGSIFIGGNMKVHGDITAAGDITLNWSELYGNITAGGAVYGKKVDGWRIHLNGSNCKISAVNVYGSDLNQSTIGIKTFNNLQYYANYVGGKYLPYRMPYYPKNTISVGSPNFSSFDWTERQATIYKWSAPKQATATPPLRGTVDYEQINHTITNDTTITKSSVFENGVNLISGGKLTFDTTKGNIYIRVKSRFVLGSNCKINLTGGNMVFIFFEYFGKSATTGNSEIIIGKNTSIGNVTVNSEQKSFNDGIYFISDLSINMALDANIVFNGYVYMPYGFITPVEAETSVNQVLNGCFAIKTVSMPRGGLQGTTNSWFIDFFNKVGKFKNSTYNQKLSPLIVDENGNVILGDNTGEVENFGEIIWEFGGYC